MNKRNYNSPIIIVIILIIMSITCSESTATKNNDLSKIENTESIPNKITNTKNFTATLKSSSTPTIPPIGLSRSNPYSISDLAHTQNWDISIVEEKRGDDAWSDIKNANMFNDPPPEGMEYLLVKIHAKSTYKDDEAHSIDECDFKVTGDKYISYTCYFVSVVTPDPKLDANLYTGGETEGWAAFVVYQGEGNIILVYDELFDFEDDSNRYIALEEGSSLTVPPELAGITPTDTGKDRKDPASRSEIIITEDWQFNIVEMYKGDKAWTLVHEANRFNDPPDDGMEYLAIKIHVRYISSEDKPDSISEYFFNTTGSAGVLYDLPSVVDPEPSLDITLYPGGEYEGWIIAQAAIGETKLILVFEPIFDFSDKNTRYIYLHCCPK